MKREVCIAKEDIPQYKFTSEDVLKNDQSGRRNRIASLIRAERLGNAFHGKVRIVFTLLDASVKEVTTTVWSAGDDFICLKGGVTVPVRAISSVDFT